MKVKMYGIPNCNTVKKAKDWLNEKGVAFEFHDFKKLGVDEGKLNQWFEKFGWEKVLNRAGLTFKKLAAEEKANINDGSSAANYLKLQTSAIKRPIVEVEDSPVLIGFDEEKYQKYFAPDHAC